MVHDAQLFVNVLPGLNCESERVVEDRHVVTHTGISVLSTPMMISMMERVCMDLIQPLLPPGWTTVGFEVHVRHKAPAGLGTSVTVFCRLIEVDSRKLLFEVRVGAGDKLIGTGTHRRTIIQIPK